MRIISLLPAATEIVCALELNNQLLGISHGCNYPPSIRKKTRISYTDTEYSLMSSRNIDAHVENRMRSKKSLYHLNKNLIEEIEPTHILTQALCDVCAITPSDIQKVIKDLSPMPEIIELNPRNLEQICGDVFILGKVFGKVKKSKMLVDRLKTKMNRIKIKTQNLSQKTVFCIEWLDPLYACGHWVPEMVGIAGGNDPLSFPNAYSCKISWDAVLNENPEIIVIMACSFSIKRSLEELSLLTDLPFWNNLKAVQKKKVWVVDGASYFNQSGIRTIDNGIEILAKIIHPEAFGKPTIKEAVNIVYI